MKEEARVKLKGYVSYRESSVCTALRGDRVVQLLSPIGFLIPGALTLRFIPLGDSSGCCQRSGHVIEFCVA